MNSDAVSSVVGQNQFEQFAKPTKEKLKRIDCKTRFRFFVTIEDTNSRSIIKVTLSQNTYVTLYAAVVSIYIPFQIVH